MATLDRSIVAVPIERLGDEVRARYRAILAQKFAASEAIPFVIPYSILAAFIIPTIWLAIPHTRSKLMRQATWAVMAFVAVFNAKVVLYTSSPNFAAAYATGLAAGWGIISTLTVLIWSSPQEDAARIVKRRVEKTSNGSVKPNGHTLHHSKEEQEQEPQVNGLRHRKANDDDGPGPAVQTSEHDQEYEYVWEPFPRTGSLLSRLNWALDMTTNFRFAGWNCSISVIPRAHTDLLTSPVDMQTLLVETKAGYRRSTTVSEFLSTRLFNIGVTYLILDFLAVAMMKDPYFVLGPDNPYPLPSYLASLPYFLLRAYRQVFSLMGMLFAILGIFNINDLFQYYLMSYLFPMRGELWQHSTTMGSYEQILDRGLAGFWGSWWHQTFRAQFLAPAAWMVKKGYIQRGTVKSVLLTAVISFLGSGFLHLCGSISSVPQTKLWRAPAFFLVQVIGMAIQHGVSMGTKAVIPAVPRRISQIGNVIFILAWMYWTAQLFTDDIASAGIWLLEPVPISLFRALGMGHPGDHWYRWDRYHWPTWYSAPHWWQSGIKV